MYIKEKNNDEAVRTLKSGDAFGELALMYNSPRTATVKVNFLFLHDRASCEEKTTGHGRVFLALVSSSVARNEGSIKPWLSHVRARSSGLCRWRNRGENSWRGPID